MPHLIAPKEADIGFTVRRLLPRGRLQRVGPFIFFDHMGPALFSPGTTRGDVLPHPHIGLATVTYLFSGALMHRDSMGVVQRIEPGAINLMTAGRGVVHSERIPEDVRSGEMPVQGIQMWLALPTEREGDAPDFAHYETDRLPVWSDEQATVHVLIGEACGERSPVVTASPTLLLDIQVAPHGRCRLTLESQELALYLASGAARINDEPLPCHHLQIRDGDSDATLDITTGDEAARLILIGGAPLPGERFIHWNFVASSREAIDRARKDWQAQRFPAVPGETEFMPLPD